MPSSLPCNSHFSRNSLLACSSCSEVLIDGRNDGCLGWIHHGTTVLAPTTQRKHIDHLSQQCPISEVVVPLVTSWCMAEHYTPGPWANSIEDLFLKPQSQSFPLNGKVVDLYIVEED